MCGTDGTFPPNGKRVEHVGATFNCEPCKRDICTTYQVVVLVCLVVLRVGNGVFLAYIQVKLAKGDCCDTYVLPLSYNGPQSYNRALSTSLL